MLICGAVYRWFGNRNVLDSFYDLRSQKVVRQSWKESVFASKEKERNSFLASSNFTASGSVRDREKRYQPVMSEFSVHLLRVLTPLTEHSGQRFSIFAEGSESVNIELKFL